MLSNAPTIFGNKAYQFDAGKKSSSATEGISLRVSPSFPGGRGCGSEKSRRHLGGRGDPTHSFREFPLSSHLFLAVRVRTLSELFQCPQILAANPREKNPAQPSRAHRCKYLIRPPEGATVVRRSPCATRGARRDDQRSSVRTASCQIRMDTVHVSLHVSPRRASSGGPSPRG